ncbi:Exonuclease, RNase T/DNA polymerase III [Candidatus Pelagibacterales bacterium]
MLSIIDLEWTSWKGSIERNWQLSWEHREIIQIGSIKFRKFENESNNFTKINFTIKPEINKHLSIYFQKLTKLTQQKINEKGKSFSSINKDLNIFFKDSEFILCNGLDKEVLIENFKLKKIVFPEFLKKIINIRPFLSIYLNKKEEEIISSKINEDFKFKNKNRHHDALFDCLNIFKSLSKIANADKEIINYCKNFKNQ